jgi:DNA-binding transcriptional regulator LsrR (DeoR family)
VEQTVRAWHRAGRSQPSIARDLGIDRRKIKRIIDHPT